MKEKERKERRREKKERGKKERRRDKKEVKKLPVWVLNPLHLTLLPTGTIPSSYCLQFNSTYCISL